MAPGTLEILVRNRFVAFPEATVRHVRANVYQARLPKSAEITRRLRGALQADEVVASIGEVEAFQTLLSSENTSGWSLTLLLP